jgi:hypothetical protein
MAVPPVPLAMTAAQFQTLLTAVAPRAQGRKTTSFASGDPVEWKTWRSGFEVIANINAWGPARAKQEIRAALEGNAARIIGDINFNAPADAAALLDIYEARFLPAAAGRMARAEFTKITQSADETLLQWHSRCREHFIRAFPNEGPEASQRLRDQFVVGITDEIVSTHVYDVDPNTYALALESAQKKSASRLIYGNRSGAAGGGLHGMERDEKRGACHFCGDLSHFQRDCKLWTKAKGILLDGQGQRGGGRGRSGQRRGRGGRGRGGGGRGRGGGGRGGLFHLGTGGDDGAAGGDDETKDLQEGLNLLTFGSEEPEN